MKRAVRIYRGCRSLSIRDRNGVQISDKFHLHSKHQKTPSLFISDTIFKHQRCFFSTNQRDSQQKEILERVQVLLDPSKKIRFDDSETWQEAGDVLQSLARQSINSLSSSMTRVDYCIRLLDKLASTLPKNEVLFASLLDTSILNRILAHWLRGIKTLSRHNQQAPSSRRNCRRQRDQPIPPTDMAEKVDKYRWYSLMQPDHKTFSYVLDAASMESDNFADELLEKLLQVSKDTPSNILIDTASVCIVMKAWIRRRRPEKAQDWLRRMQDLYRNHGWQQLKPNAIAYTTIIHGWAQAGNVDQAEDMLKEQLLDFQDGNDACRPDARTFNAVLNGWAKSKQNPQAADRCKIIINQMLQLCSNAGWDCAPDDYSLTSAMVCFTNNAGPEKAERLLGELLEATKLPPSIAMYNVILRGYAQVGNGEDAKELLQTIRKTNQTTPDEITFNTVLSAWSKSKSPSAPQQAESILWTMQEYGMSPSVVSFGAVLQCWSQHAKISKVGALRADQLLHQMQSQHGVKPNIICYNIVLSAWATVAREFRDTDALDRATLLFHELLQEESIQPTVSTFRTMFYLIAGSTIRNKGERAQAVVHLMERCELQPSDSDKKLIQRLSKKQI
jgi:pentatricopeptide repeat protein